MALERFMIYVEGRPGQGIAVTYCWGFRASLAAARKMAQWPGFLPVITVDLDTLRETRWFGDTDARGRREYQPSPADPPMADFLSSTPRPIRRRFGTAPGDLLIGETDLRGGLTAWSPVAQFSGESRPNRQGIWP